MTPSGLHDVTYDEQRVRPKMLVRIRPVGHIASRENNRLGSSNFSDSFQKVESSAGQFIHSMVIVDACGVEGTRADDVAIQMPHSPLRFRRNAHPMHRKNG